MSQPQKRSKQGRAQFNSQYHQKSPTLVFTSTLVCTHTHTHRGSQQNLHQYVQLTLGATQGLTQVFHSGIPELILGQAQVSEALVHLQQRGQLLAAGCCESAAFQPAEWPWGEIRDSSTLISVSKQHNLMALLPWSQAMVTRAPSPQPGGGARTHHSCCRGHLRTLGPCTAP